ncbi:MAG: histidine kinase [Puniceicoccaceae bacterium]|nr:MAG: histidine kinase [Puniceicoccaceae bacterium]
MLSWILGLVVLLLGGLLLRQRRRHRQTLTDLARAIERRVPYLSEEPPPRPGRAASPWTSLTGEVNRLIDDYGQLHTRQAGQLSQLEATLGNLQEAVLIVDRFNYILLVNKALRRIIPGVRTILGQRVEGVLQGTEILEALEEVRQRGGLPQREIELRHARPPVWMEITGTKLSEPQADNGPWVLLVLHDISRLKRLESVRKEFVANVSHELKTPLSVIKGYVETLVDDHATMRPADREKFLGILQRHTNRLTSLLEDLLTLSRLESRDPRVTLQPEDLGAFVRSLAEEHALQIMEPHRRIQLDVPGEPFPVLIDPLRISQVYSNLLDNALKYTPASASIEIGLRRADGEVHSWVRDSGPGIPEADLPHIFERFYRVDKGRSRETGGTGLGLSIVKHIVQLHHGRVWAESRPGEGCRIAFALPLAKEAAAAGAAAPAAAAGSAPAGPGAGES